MSVPQSGKIYKILRCHYIHLYGTVLTQLRILIKDSDNTLQTYELYGGYIKVSGGLWPIVSFFKPTKAYTQAVRTFALYARPYNRGSAGSLQQNGFRENPTYFLTFIAH